MENGNNVFNQNTNVLNLTNNENLDTNISNNLQLNNSNFVPLDTVNNNVINQDNAIPNFVNYDSVSTVAENNSQVILQNQENTSTNGSQVLYDTTNQINDKPVVEKKQKKFSININQELKTALILMIVLLIIIWVVPEVLDLFY